MPEVNKNGVGKTTEAKMAGIRRGTESEKSTGVRKALADPTGFDALPAELRDYIKGYALLNGTQWQDIRLISRRYRDITDYVLFEILTGKILEHTKPAPSAIDRGHRNIRNRLSNSPLCASPAVTNSTTTMKSFLSPYRLSFPVKLITSGMS
jgi:hypothetical protein